MNTWRRLTMATTAAYATFRRVYADPAAGRRSQIDDDRLSDYALLWAYHENYAFEDVQRWAGYRGQYHLYRGTRPIYNPARRLTDFYAGTVYQGDWSADPAKMTTKSAAIPWGEKTPAELLALIAQIYQWSNWQSKSRLGITYAASVGDCMIIAVDDLERRKVYPEIIWPGWVTDIDLDPTGNVQAYTLEYDVLDEETERAYTYRREVDKDMIRTYRDGAPHGYQGQPAEYPNPYGFVPAAWLQHTITGAPHGKSALRNISKIDELNALAAHALDQIHRIQEAPILLAGSNIGSALSNQQKAASNNTASREEMKIITGEAGATIETAKIDPGETIAHMDHMIAEIERDHPELGMFAKLREMSSVTGPGADRMFGDVGSLVNGARAQYDQQTIKIFQMCAAIGGWRAGTGAWGLASQLTNQQRAFLGYDLSSYAAGNLDLSIQSRPLIMPSPEDELRLEQMRNAVAADRAYRTASPGQQQPAAVADRIRQAANAQNAQTPAATAQAAQGNA